MGGIWWRITMNNAIYGNIVVPIWIMLFVFAICFCFVQYIRRYMVVIVFGGKLL